MSDLAGILLSTSAIPEYAWRKVYVTGEFDHEHSIELGPKTRDGQLGYHVFTPLKRGDGQDTILVNRGFVKREYRDPNERPASLVRSWSRDPFNGLSHN